MLSSTCAVVFTSIDSASCPVEILLFIADLPALSSESLTSRPVEVLSDVCPRDKGLAARI